MSAARKWMGFRRVAGVFVGAAVGVVALCSPATGLANGDWDRGRTFSTKAECEKELKRLKAKGEIKDGYCSHEGPCRRALRADHDNCGYYVLYRDR